MCYRVFATFSNRLSSQDGPPTTNRPQGVPRPAKRSAKRNQNQTKTTSATRSHRPAARRSSFVFVFRWVVVLFSTRFSRIVQRSAPEKSRSSFVCCFSPTAPFGLTSAPRISNFGAQGTWGRGPDLADVIVVVFCSMIARVLPTYRRHHIIVLDSLPPIALLETFPVGFLCETIQTN